MRGYDNGMTKTKRVAVTIPEDVLAEVERLREHQQQSRSTVVTEALLAWLRAQRVDAAEQRYTRGYLAKLPSQRTSKEPPRSPPNPWLSGSRGHEERRDLVGHHARASGTTPRRVGVSRLVLRRAGSVHRHGGVHDDPQYTHRAVSPPR
jgi:Arc/MetJ-type ribon-helix-helix transcriptional regulator